MEYMKIKGFNPPHIFALLNNNVNIKKPLLINNCIKQTNDYKQYEAEELRKSEFAFEMSIYGKEV
ncbi:unnamed protein product [marine sediment metagenome]|uniref:Uncharacterized protein n=1 Tax=marine sediment metagenome TaxID=412755 RepID=X0SEZ5_9ZZZZ